MSKGSRLILILGDQLTADISLLASADQQRDTVLMAEVIEEATYVRHHKKKIAFLFSAMRHFAGQLTESGWSVSYTKLDAQGNTGSLEGEVGRSLQTIGASEIVLTEPGEWRLKQIIKQWSSKFSIKVTMLEDSRFICSHKEFQAWAQGRKQLRMEYFYRDMRRKTDLLMSDGAPEGERWNFDAENRKPAKTDLSVPDVLRTQPDPITKEVLQLVGAKFPDHFGELEPFWFAVTSAGAKQALRHNKTTAINAATK